MSEEKSNEQSRETSSVPTDDELKSRTLNVFTLDHVSLEYSPKMKHFVMRSRQSGKILHKLPGSVAQCYTTIGLGIVLEQFVQQVTEMVQVLAKALIDPVPPQETEDDEGQDEAA